MEQVATTSNDRPQPEAALPTTIGGAARGQHPIDIRLTLPLGFGRYYFVVLAGKERRSKERLARERAQHPLLKFGNVVLICAVAGVSAVALFAMLELLLIKLLRASGYLT